MEDPKPPPHDTSKIETDWSPEKIEIDKQAHENLYTYVPPELIPQYDEEKPDEESEEEES